MDNNRKKKEKENWIGAWIILNLKPKNKTNSRGSAISLKIRDSHGKIKNK